MTHDEAQARLKNIEERDPTNPAAWLYHYLVRQIGGERVDAESFVAMAEWCATVASESPSVERITPVAGKLSAMQAYHFVRSIRTGGHAGDVRVPAV